MDYYFAKDFAGPSFALFSMPHFIALAAVFFFVLFVILLRWRQNLKLNNLFRISHGAIIIAALYMTIVEGYRPTWRSFGRVFLWLNIYAVIVYFVNILVGSNYMFVTHKPDTASLLDVMGPWPIYIFAEVVALMIFLILYLPFALSDLR